MITKLYGALMLKLARIIVKIKNVRNGRKKLTEQIFFNTELLALTYDFETFGTPARRKEIKETCESHDYCEQCDYYTADGCLFADDDRGIPCYWSDNNGI